MADECDDELPPISVNSSLRESGKFSMPSADVLASQRAREEECEKELLQLRFQYEKEKAAVKLMGSDSSGSESEASLAAAVNALRVNSTTYNATEPDAADVVAKLAVALINYDTTFLSQYLELLNSKSNDIIYSATYEIVSNIEKLVMESLCEDVVSPWSTGDLIVVCSWVIAACVWGSPRLSAVGRLLPALLRDVTPQQVGEIGAALGAAAAGPRAQVQVQVLVRAADAALGPRPAQRLLADRLLAAALSALNTRPQTSLDVCRAEVSLRDVTACVREVWRGAGGGGAGAHARHAALLVAGRALSRAAGAGAGAGEDARALLAALSHPPQHQHRHTPEYLKVLVGASKLQILFSSNN